MRRARFAGAVEIPGDSRARASVREALWFDILSPESPDEESLAAQRITPLDYSAIVLGITHLIASIALLVLFPERSQDAHQAYLSNVVQ